MEQNTVQTNQDVIRFEQLDKKDQLELNINDITVLDKIELSGKAKNIGLLKSLFYSALSIFVFFIQIDIGGTKNIPFGHIVNFLVNLLGNAGVWVCAVSFSLVGIFSVYGIYFAKKDSKLGKYYDGDSKIHPILYLFGGFYCTLYALQVTVPGFQGPEILVGPLTAGTILPVVVLPGLWIIPVSCIFIPFLLNYGLVDAVGALGEPLMRPLLKLPGRSVVNAIVSFVGSCTCGILITIRQFGKGMYTKKESVIIATGFSAVSVGCANLAIRIAGLEDYFVVVYLSSLLMLVCVCAVMCRIPPLRGKDSIYADGHLQTREEILAQRGSGNVFGRAITRAQKKAYISDTISNPLREVALSVSSTLSVFPKIMTLLGSIGMLGLVVAHYTPIFEWMGYIFLPLLNLLGVEDASIVATSLAAGIGDMTLPTSVMASFAQEVAIESRYIVASVSICQVVFLAETIPVILTLGIRAKFWELILLFFERTLVAIPFAVLFASILF